MTTLLVGLITFYLGFHAQRMEPRPEDRKEGEIAEAPGSWGSSRQQLVAAVVRHVLGHDGVGVASGWWLFIIGPALGAVALSGLIFEYYRGEHAH